MRFLKYIFVVVSLSILLVGSVLPVVSAVTVDEKVNTILGPDVIRNNTGKLPPTGNFKKEIIPQAIKMLLALVGTISFAVFVYAGIMLIIAQGNEEEITKFKNMLIWSAVGLAFITTSYAIVTGVMQIAFK